MMPGYLEAMACEKSSSGCVRTDTGPPVAAGRGATCDVCGAGAAYDCFTNGDESCDTDEVAAGEGAPEKRDGEVTAGEDAPEKREGEPRLKTDGPSDDGELTSVLPDRASTGCRACPLTLVCPRPRACGRRFVAVGRQGLVLVCRKAHAGAG